MKYQNANNSEYYTEYYIGKILGLAGIIILTFFCINYFRNEVKISKNQKIQKDIEQRYESIEYKIKIKTFSHCQKKLLICSNVSGYLRMRDIITVAYIPELEKLYEELKISLKNEDTLKSYKNIYTIGIIISISMIALGFILIIGKNLFMSISQKGNFGIGVNQGKVLGNSTGISDTVNNVNNAISKLANNLEELEIKKLLTQIRETIVTEKKLENEDKIEALEQIKILAESAKNPTDINSRKIAKTAIKILKGTASNLPNATKLVQNTNELLYISIC